MARLICLCGFFGVDVTSLRADLTSLVKERLLMHLIGHAPLHLNYGERQRFVAKRLRKLSGLRSDYTPTHLSPEVQPLVDIQEAVVSALNEAKDGVHSLDERSALDLIHRQGSRCAICGVPLRASIRRASRMLPDGIEPLSQKYHLDHVVPYYFFGNRGGRQILCAACNLVKNDRIGVQEDGLVISGNHVRNRGRTVIRRRMMFWTLQKSPACGHFGCLENSTTALMFVQLENKSIPYMYGNLVVRCEEHASQDAEWIHQSQDEPEV